MPSDVTPPGVRRHHRPPDIRQAEAAECGLACLAVVAWSYGHRIDLATLRRNHPVSLKGMTLSGLMEAAQQVGLTSRPLRMEPAHLKTLRLPAILHWDMCHFVVLLRTLRNGDIVIQDPASGSRRLNLADAGKHFSGVALELTPSAAFQPADPVPRLRLPELVGSLRGLGSPLLQALTLTFVLQACVLAAPFYLQLSLDEAVAKHDASLLNLLAVGFGLLLVFNVTAGLFRSWILACLQGQLAFGLGTRVFGHLVQLPLAYFERRHVSDLVSRFGSLDPIRSLLAEGMIAATADGVMAILTACVIVLYSATLGAVVLAALAVYIAIRLGFYRVFRRRSLDLVQARARETGAFLETARAIQSIKVFNREAQRNAVWANRCADVAAADIAVNRLKAMFRCTNDLVFGTENLVIVYLGAQAAIDGRMTVGMLFAFMAYKQQFVDKAARLVEKMIEFRMLDLHLQRLADIVRADPEPAAQTTSRPVIQGGLEVRDLAFRYSAGEPFIFRGVSFRIEPGEYVAIVGPSGAGKTTLLKIMLGLLEPEEGDVLVDGTRLRSFGIRAFREQIGVVMQDDRLLSGSVADNICFFDDRIDFEHMHQCAAIAGVHEEIMRMPMAYNTLVGDMGSSLSGGQLQRVLLARALYRRPRILFMDEGTSHLDLATEMRVNAAIGTLGVTRVIIAHRPETIASAERRLVIDGRTVCEAVGNAQD